jgi:hypothetical protein
MGISPLKEELEPVFGPYCSGRSELPRLTRPCLFPEYFYRSLGRGGDRARWRRITFAVFKLRALPDGLIGVENAER